MVEQGLARGEATAGCRACCARLAARLWSWASSCCLAACQQPALFARGPSKQRTERAQPKRSQTLGWCASPTLQLAKIAQTAAAPQLPAAESAQAAVRPAATAVDERRQAAAPQQAGARRHGRPEAALRGAAGQAGRGACALLSLRRPAGDRRGGADAPAGARMCASAVMFQPPPLPHVYCKQADPAGAAAWQEQWQEQAREAGGLQDALRRGEVRSAGLWRVETARQRSALQPWPADSRQLPPSEHRRLVCAPTRALPAPSAGPSSWRSGWRA